MKTDKPLMKEVLPDLSNELKTLLEKESNFHLAESIDLLRIYEKCECDETSCASFYTVPKPNGAYGIEHESLMLDANEGLLILDLVENEIKFVEILNRPEIRKNLIKI